jgi:hypothetical protein
VIRQTGITIPGNGGIGPNNSEPQEQSRLLKWTEKTAALSFDPSGIESHIYLWIRSQRCNRLRHRLGHVTLIQQKRISLSHGPELSRENLLLELLGQQRKLKRKINFNHQRRKEKQAISFAQFSKKGQQHEESTF